MRRSEIRFTLTATRLTSSKVGATTVPSGGFRGYARRVSGGGLTLAAVLACGVWLGHRLDPTWTDRPTRLVPFSGTDQQGRSVSERDFAGHAVVADFIFTRCRGACPTLTARLAALRRLVTDPEVRFVSFSIDPAHDTPAALRAYAARWGAEDGRWRLLSLDATTVKAVARGLGQFVGDGAGGPVAHSDRFVLIDPTGEVRDTFPSDDPGAMRQLADALAAPRVSVRP
jgi:protein SCO1/2